MPKTKIRTPYRRFPGFLYDLYMKNTYRPIRTQLKIRLMIFKAVLHWLLFTSTPDDIRKPSCIRSANEDDKNTPASIIEDES